jgi:5'-AMP-activated protein kinase catalytic alpha subunit
MKPENLLLNENRIIKIIDFGLSNHYENSQLLSTPCGSPCYAAPEMIQGKKYSGLSVDLWSTGIILYAIVCGFLPFEVKKYLRG